MNQTTTLNKMQSNKSITDSKLIILLKDLIRPVLSLIASFRVPYKVIIEQPCRLLPEPGTVGRWGGKARETPLVPAALQGPRIPTQQTA